MISERKTTMPTNEPMETHLHSEPTKDPEHRPRAIVPAAIVGIVLVALGAGTWLAHNAAAGVNKVAMSDTPKSVTVAAAKTSTFRETRRYVGTIEPWLDAKVGPQLASGFVGTVLVRPGDVVKRGAVLATLDCRNASAANQAVAMQARSLQEREKAASREAARLNELLAGGYASPNEVEQKQGQAAADSAQIQSLLAQASGKSLEVNDCVLRAPFDGEIAIRYVDPGAFVKPGAPVVEVVDRSILRLTADVPEIDFDAIAPDTEVKFHVVATNQSLEGKVSRRAPAADPATRTVHFEIDLPDPKRSIPVGTTAEMFVDVGKPKPTTEIPLLAAKIRGSNASLFVVENNQARSKSVAIVGERGASLFVDRDELKAGEHVVTQGRGLLTNNDKVVAKLESLEGPPGDAPEAPKVDTKDVQPAKAEAKP